MPGVGITTVHDRSFTFLAPLSLLSTLSLSTVALAGQPLEIQQPRDEQAIWGGSEAEPCAWPTVVRVTGNGSLCTGSLIHPRVVMYAAHCGSQGKVVRFGDTPNTGQTIQVEYCKTNPGYSGQGSDWAYCVLQQEITQIPFTPVGFGCEVNQYYGNGASIAVVGFGNNTGDTGAGTKRWGFTTITNATQTRFDVGGNSSTTICSGDSGGPAFIRYADQSWHVYGIASTKNDNTCSSAKGTHSLAVNAVKWIEQDSGIDVTVCHDINGNWDPGPLCGNFFNGQPSLSYGSWYTWCQDATALAWSSTCGTDFHTDNYEQIAPQLEISAPYDGQAFEESSVTLDITVLAQDNGGLPVEVQLEIQGMLQPLFSKDSPAVFTANFPTGEFTIVAHGKDFWGNTAQSQSVTFTVGPISGGDGDGDGDGDSGGQGETDGGPTTLGETGGGWPLDDSGTGSSNGCSIGSRSTDRSGAWLALGLFGLLWIRRRRS